jgi:hypothetical protein
VLVSRTLAGETLRQICAEAGMPSLRGVGHWMEQRAGFAEAMRAARAAAGRSLNGRKLSYCPATAEAIFERLCEGEAMVRICADADMPVASTVYRWLAAEPEFAEAVALARDIQADRAVAEGLELARAVTPKTARACEVQLRQLRWTAGKLAPRKYGTLRAAEPEELARRQTVLFRSFRIEKRADGWRRVRSSYADPDTGKIIEEPPKGEWSPPPQTEEQWNARMAAARAAREAAGTGAAPNGSSPSGPPPDDPEGWL